MTEDERERAARLQEQLEPMFLTALRTAAKATGASERDAAQAVIALALARLAMLDANLDTEAQIRRAWETVALQDEDAPYRTTQSATEAL